MKASLLPWCLLFVSGAACSSGANPPEAGAPAPTASLRVSDAPIAGATMTERLAFESGDALFELPERPADGLGPLFTNDNCAACHRDGARGPGAVKKMSVVEPDGYTPASDQSLLRFGHTARPFAVSPATTPIGPPSDAASVRVTLRLGPPVFGRGYLEAIADSEIERVAREQAASGGSITGRINRVRYGSENTAEGAFPHAKGELLIGRFGVKARIATLEDVTADALLSDMGITSPLRPLELPNPDGLDDDQKPGVDTDLEHVTERASYLRLLAIPARSPDQAAGAESFRNVECAVCHVPSLRTRADYPIQALAGVDAPVYSDLLLHDMGEALSDGMAEGVDGEATASEFRSAPLLGVRFNRLFLHDGRARSVREAILLHQGPASEANASIAAFLTLSPSEQARLVEFVESL